MGELSTTGGPDFLLGKLSLLLASFFSLEFKKIYFLIIFLRVNKSEFHHEKKGIEKVFCCVPSHLKVGF